jgi:hypothetical protein
MMQGQVLAGELFRPLIRRDEDDDQNDELQPVHSCSHWTAIISRAQQQACGTAARRGMKKLE